MVFEGFFQGAHRVAVVVCAVCVGWTASTMWTAANRRLKEPEDDFDGGEEERDQDQGPQDAADPPSHAALYAEQNPECSVKMVFAVRTDLRMQKGKMCAQVAHAAVDCVSYAMDVEARLLDKWEECGCTKVCLKVNSEEELLEIEAAATACGLITSVVEDEGRTQVAHGSRTVCGVGPGPDALIDQCTGHLKLL